MATSKHHAREESLDKAKSRSKHWERKAKEGIERIIGTENERDRVKEKVEVAQLVVIATGEAKAQAEDDLARAQSAMVTAEEVKCKAEVETTLLEVERTSLLLEIGAAKDEV